MEYPKITYYCYKWFQIGEWGIAEIKWRYNYI